MYEAGAHFIKVLSSYEATINALTSAPAFGFAPLLVTGGMNLNTMPAIGAKGVSLFASGFDIIASGRADVLSQNELAARLKEFRETALLSRAAHFPELEINLPDAELLRRLPWAVPENILQ